VAGLPVVVHDDVAEAREAVGRTAAFYEHHANYQRVLQTGGASSAVDAAIIGDEATVRRGIERVIEAGATDFWASVVPAGDDRRASTQRTTDLLRELLD
jgi:alkanesulfonate monooxygenase SsuD/methylene tetrahydromethanopterin reductase-like flavin-dependent oxidoreductase (luciferase family)